MRKVKLTFTILFFLLLCFTITLHSCMTFRMSPNEIDNFFVEKGLRGSQHKYAQNFRNIHYVHSGDNTKPLIVFVHGSPGSLSAFIDFMADTVLLEKAQLITTDRPGFGYSNFGVAEPSLQNQAALLKPILEKYKDNRPIILVGHSLGGPVIARMAMDFPELIDGLVLVAASIDPELEPNETWFRAPLATPFLSWILPRSFRASNEEIYQLKPQLYAMMPLWKTISCPVIVVQGDKDSLVAPGNADFAEKMLVNTTVKVIRKSDMNHFVPWSNPELIRDAVLELVQQRTVSTISH
jgi:pimeloyl-ACP methyl ester carboxylesterase